MPTSKTQKLSSWLLSLPALFALMSFGFMFVAAILTGFIANMVTTSEIVSRIIIGGGVTLAFLTAVAILLRKLPPHNLDRHSFVAINNAQIGVVSLVFIISTLLIITNANKIMMHLLWMETHAGATFIAVMITAALFYLYMTGIYIANLYAKYRRVRTLGVPMWRTICTAPFGFAMLWIPGYILPEANEKSPVLTVRAKWYSRLTDWILSTPVRSGAALTVVLLLSGFFFGFNALLLTLALGLVFAIWALRTGPKTLRTNISGAYTYTAIGINIAVWIAVICIAAFAPTKHDVNINITDTNAPQTQQL